MVYLNIAFLPLPLQVRWNAGGFEDLDLPNDVRQ